MSWSRAFHIPISLPDGRVLRTLRDAGEYIQELPRATHERPRVAAAIVRFLLRRLMLLLARDMTVRNSDAPALALRNVVPNTLTEHSQFAILHSALAAGDANAIRSVEAA